MVHGTVPEKGTQGENARADSLSKFGATLEGVSSRKISVMIKEMPGIDKIEPKAICPIGEEQPWKTDIVRYLTTGELPSDPVEAKRLKFRACRFTMLQGSCGNHSGGRSLAQKVVRQGYFWPTLVKDTMEFAKRCESCQRHATLIHTPATPMEPIKISCPFDQWGIDILGPFPPAIAQKKFIIVAVEYFTKWVEAEVVAKISEKEEKRS